MPSGRFCGHDCVGDGSGRSLTQCIEHLCTIQLRKNISTKPSYLKPNVSVRTYLKQVKRAAFDVLFSSRHQSDSDAFPGALLSSEEWTEKNIINAVAFRLRTTQRRFYDADRLEELTEQFLNDDDGSSPTLRFLLCLSDVKDYPTKRCNFWKRRKAPTRDEIRKIARRKGQLYAGDYPYDFFNSTYTVFPPWHFKQMDIDHPVMYPEKEKNIDQDLLHAKRYSSPDLSVYRNSKGLFGLQSEFFSDKGLTDSPYEIDSQTRLYGGLRHSRTFDLDIKLSYPKITGPIDMMASIASSMTSIDEGFVSPASSIEFSDSEGELSERKSRVGISTCLVPYHGYRSPDYDLSLWKDCLTNERSSHRTWETLGLPAGTTKHEYYLTEAGGKVFDEIWQHRAKIIHKLTNFLHESPVPTLRWTEVSQEKLIEHAALVTMGVASDTFQFNGLAQMFLPRKNLFFSGVDPEALHSLLTQFSEWGTCYWRLVHFSAFSITTPQMFNPTISFFQLQREKDNFEENGAVFKAFTDAIRRYLHEYHHQVLALNLQNMTLQNVALHLRKPGAQIRYICQLCECGEPDLPAPSPDTIKDFPTGVALLSYLYDEAVHCPEPNHYLALLYLLRKSCLPYLQFVKDWVFRGNCWDAKGEFMLRVNVDFGGARRDRQRWLKYVEPAKPDDPGSCVPSFLSSMASDIYTCGKTVALLQFVSPEHFLVVDGVDHPELEITFSKRKLQQIGNNWKRHDLKMKQLETDRTTHWIEKEEELKAAAHRVALMVRKAAKEEIVKMQEAVKEERKERNEIKRKEFQRLKKQAEDEAARRALVIQAEKEEDLKRETERHKKEALKQAEENRMLLEEKEKIISHYENLNFETEKRILKASWIDRRNRLQSERINFHTDDEKFWQHELSKSSLGPNTANMAVAGPDPYREGLTSANQTLDSSVDMNAFLSPESNADPEPDFLQEFLNEALFVKQEQKHTQEEPVDDSDIEKVLRIIKSEEFFSGGGAEGHFKKPRIASGNHDVSEETLDGQSSEIKVHRKIVPGQSILNSNFAIGEDPQHPLTPNVTMTSNEGVTKSSMGKIFSATPPAPDSTISVAQVEGRNVSNSTIGDLMGSSKTPSSVEDEGSKATRKTVSGQHISLTSLGSEEDFIPAQARMVKNRMISDSSMTSIMQESAESEITSKIFKKIVPGQGVSFSTVGGLLNPADVEESSKLMETPPKQDSVMGGILYGSPGPGGVDVPSEKNVLISDVVAPTTSNPTDSTIQALMYGGKVNETCALGKKMVQGQNVSISCIKDLMNLRDNNGEEPLSNMEIDRLRKFALANRSHRGHHSQSSVQSLVFYDDTDPWDLRKDSESSVAILKASALKPAVNKAKRHPSYSTLQLLMYPDAVVTERERGEAPILMDKTFHLQLPSISSYSEALEHKISQPSQLSGGDGNKFRAVDLIGNVTGKSLENEFEDDTLSCDWRADIDAVDMHALPVLLRQCVLQPIMRQVALANRCIINYFMVDVELMRHFEMLRHFCFMEDGEFSQVLSTQLFEKMHSGCRPIDLLNPVVIGSLITHAVQGSMHRNSPHAKKLTFSVRQLPAVFSTNDPSSLDCFILKYVPGWPCNIVITESNQQKYEQVFAFLLKLKHVMWTLHDVVSKLSSMESLSAPMSKFELRQLHLYRHEMQNFVKVMQGYVSTQVVHVCWHEFQDSLKSAKCLEDLHTLHVEYLRKCIYRCLLTKNTSVIMNVITDVFKSILRFWTQLSSKTVAFSKLQHTYRTFQRCSKFLFKVVSKLVDCGYQPHLEDFLIRLNYNGFYER